jgi:hypothetical protein
MSPDSGGAPVTERAPLAWLTLRHWHTRPASLALTVCGMHAWLGGGGRAGGLGLAINQGGAALRRAPPAGVCRRAAILMRRRARRSLASVGALDPPRRAINIRFWRRRQVQEDVQLRHELKRLRYETKRILVQRDRRKEEYDKVILQEQLVSQNG